MKTHFDIEYESGEKVLSIFETSTANKGTMCHNYDKQMYSDVYIYTHVSPKKYIYTRCEDEGVCWYE